jgi:hypoxanthine-DNA glycosylase
MQIYSFPAISNHDAKVLVLGTMPGVQSLKLNQYYGHNQNAFWKIMFTIFEEPFSQDYEIRKELVLQNTIAIWDVLQTCVREGSLDSAIEQEVPNDFNAFLAAHPNIEHIFFNGQKAAYYFKKYVAVSEKYKLHTLPSTSPAHAAQSVELKKEAWQIIQQVVTNTNRNILFSTIKNMETIAIKNAGLVLLNNYIEMLFDRLHLLSNKQFTSAENQSKATQYLQYLVTGLSHTEEMYLPLNKVLCGLPIRQSVPNDLTISEEEINLIKGLISAAISYWSVIGETSVDGFRGNWLVRDGSLRELEDRWELTVDKRAYDVLINQSPFSFSIIKYPWMEKPLYVTWPY